jgi:hypothetical protein
MRLCECDWELVPIGLRRAGFWPFREGVGWFPVSLQYPIGIPHVSVIFSFILIWKLIHTYLIRIRQYPSSIRYRYGSKEPYPHFVAYMLVLIVLAYHV